MNINVDKLYMITHGVQELINDSDIDDVTIKIKTNKEDLNKIDKYFKDLNPDDSSNKGDCSVVNVNFFGVHVEIVS